MTGALDLVRRMARDRTALLGALLILGLLVAAAAAPWLATHPADIAEFHPAERLRPPSAAHYLGTDRMGSDVYSRLLFGARITIMIALIAVAGFVLVLPTLVMASGTKKSTPHFSGAITAWDETSKQGAVKDSAGKEHSFAWNNNTTVTGAPKLGEHASVSYTKDKDGKAWAKHISVGLKPAQTEPAVKK